MFGAKQQFPDLKVVARSPFKLYYEGPAKIFTATNAVGQFDILPGHRNFFSIINPGQVVIGTDKDPVTIDVSNGIVSCQDGEVTLFANM